MHDSLMENVGRDRRDVRRFERGKGGEEEQEEKERKQKTSRARAKGDQILPLGFDREVTMLRLSVRSASSLSAVVTCRQREKGANLTPMKGRDQPSNPINQRSHED
jgi:hypothetical protein